ncbi:BrnA antitoxin family protein [Modicisalibacter radicis]
MLDVVVGEATGRYPSEAWAPKADVVKERVTVRLDPDVVATFRETAPAGRPA